MLSAASQRRYEGGVNTYFGFYPYSPQLVRIGLEFLERQKERGKNIDFKKSPHCNLNATCQILEGHSYNIAIGIGLFIDIRLKRKEF